MGVSIGVSIGVSKGVSRGRSKGVSIGKSIGGKTTGHVGGAGQLPRIIVSILNVSTVLVTLWQCFAMVWK